jgi:hypothetical protein
VYTPAIAGKKKKKKNTHSIMPPPFSLSIDIKKSKLHLILFCRRSKATSQQLLPFACHAAVTPQVFN